MQNRLFFSEREITYCKIFIEVFHFITLQHVFINDEKTLDLDWGGHWISWIFCRIPYSTYSYGKYVKLYMCLSPCCYLYFLLGGTQNFTQLIFRDFCVKTAVCCSWKSSKSKNQTKIFVGRKTKTIQWKMLKHSVKMQGVIYKIVLKFFFFSFWIRNIE